MRSYSQEEEGDDKPSDEIDAEGTVELSRVGVGREDAGARNVEQGERQPEATIGCEGCK